MSENGQQMLTVADLLLLEADKKAEVLEEEHAVGICGHIRMNDRIHAPSPRGTENIHIAPQQLITAHKNSSLQEKYVINLICRFNPHAVTPFASLHVHECIVLQKLAM